MTASPILWGAGLACALGGAIAGTALGSTPAVDRSTVAMLYQSHDDAYSPAQGQGRLPDHYPLVTRQGIVQVAELSERGLYAQARYRSLYGDPGPGLAYDPDELGSEMHDAGQGIGDPVTEPATARDALADGSVPLQLADGAAGLPGGGGAKTVDVRAVLALR